MDMADVKDAKEVPVREYNAAEWIPKVEAMIDATENDMQRARDLGIATNVAVEQCDELSVERFKEQYESKSIPVLIKGIPQKYRWNAIKRWDIYGKPAPAKTTLKTEKEAEKKEETNVVPQMAALSVSADTSSKKKKKKKKQKNQTSSDANYDETVGYFHQGDFPSFKFRISDRTTGPSHLTMPAYLQYLNTQSEPSLKQDISPMYLFDTLKDSKINNVVCEDYKIPPYFKTDFFEYLGPDRPSYRWILIGPRRSGTGLHIDPWGTSAWNTNIQGRKRWMLFPAKTPERLARGLDFELKDDKIRDDFSKNMDACLWYTIVLPQIIARESKLPLDGPDAKKLRNRLGMVEFIQEPGDTIFVPGGWLHCVLNITDTMAVTQNFADDYNFRMVWKQVRVAKKYSWDFLDGLEDSDRGDMVKVAEEMNKADGFTLAERWCPGDLMFAEEPIPTSDSESEVYSEEDVNEYLDI